MKRYYTRVNGGKALSAGKPQFSISFPGHFQENKIGRFELMLSLKDKK
jgi:hypothetical protein